MEIKEYQKLAALTDYPKGIKYDSVEFFAILLGLSGEAGEIMEKFKKIYWHKKGEINQEDILAIKKELGDILWYTSSLAGHLNLDLEEIAKENIEKLKSRIERGVHKGNGDNR
jgi:NTP pyrophosphatase (non-canonical NTP hydrolase)